MIKYKKTVNHIGWIIGILTSVLYILCAEPTLSFWDSGEYILSSSKLQVGHPPGAPLYQIIGAFFSIFSFSNLKLIPILVNSLSALASGATICFLFWIIVRLMYRFSNKYISNIIAGVIGALVFAFSDTFWNSAIEAEVYALSILFTTITFWSILKWDEKPHPRWIIFIVFMIGLSIGVHLLSLLVLPAIILIIYFHYKKGTLSGIITTLIISSAIIGITLWLIIPGILKLISLNPILVIITIVVILALLFALSLWKKLPLLNTIILAIAFFLIGYSTFFVLVIRAQADTPINEYRPNTAKGLTSYLNREAYGKTPLVYGPSYTALPPKDFKITEKGLEPIFDRELMMLFPRMWNYNNPNYEIGYVDWVGIPQDTVVIDGIVRAKPSWIQNIQFFANYQIGYMYSRYLLWNFVGKTNDEQGFGDNHRGQWMTGIEPIDEFMGKSTDVQPSHRVNKANNLYFGIPFLLALIGLFYQIGRDTKGWFALMALFIFTGVAITIYLNEFAYQPRERDYAYVGSFMVFSIWVAIGSFAISQWLVNLIRVKKPKYVLPCFFLVPGLMFAQNFNDHNRSHRYTAHNFASSILLSCDENAILFVNGDNDTFPLWYLQEVEGIRQDVRVINLQLLNSPEYIEKLRKKVYSSEKIELIAKKETYYNNDWNICFINPSNKTLELKSALKDLYNEKNAIQINKSRFYALASNKIQIGIDSSKSMEINIESSDMTKSTMIVYDIIASNINKRPIYFSNYSIDDIFGFEEYISNEGFLNKLTTQKQKPQNIIVETKDINFSTDKMYENLMHNYAFKNFDKKNIYYDELHRSIIEQFAQQTSILTHLLIEEGKPEKALAVANLCIDKIPPTIHNYPYVLSEISIAYSLLEEDQKAEALMSIVVKYFTQEMDYFLDLTPYEQSQNRLTAQKLIGSWISLCEITEQWGLEPLRVQLADQFFTYASPYCLACFDQLSRLNKNPEYYAQEIERLNSLLETIYSFAEKYEEELPVLKQ